MSESLVGKQILYEGSVQPWETGWTFIQMLALALAARNDLVYIDTPLSVARLRAGTLGRLRSHAEAVPGGVTLFRSATFPAQKTPRLRRIAAARTAHEVRRWTRRSGFEPDLLWIFSPQGLALVERFPDTPAVYWTGDHAELLPGEAQLYAHVVAILCVSKPVQQRLSETYPGKAHFTPVAVDFERFDAARSLGAIDAQLDGLQRPIAGYAGSVNRRLDVPLVVELARTLDGTVVLAGPEQLTDGERSALAAERNVVLLGPQSAEQLPSLMLGFDVALIPYVEDEFNLNCNPVKFYEYLALGLPTVTTRIPTLDEFDGPASVAPRETFVARVLEMISCHQVNVDTRVSIARAHSFDALLERLDQVPIS